MCAEISVDCSNAMDLYDEAILGQGPSSDPDIMEDSPSLVYESKGSGDSQRMNLYDDVNLQVTYRDENDNSSSRNEYSRLQDSYSHDGRYHDSSKYNDSRYYERHHSSSECHKSNKTPGCEDFCLYIGNLTWWTSEADIAEAIHSLGVPDFVDVKFFENASNGQSKGFCKLVLGSEKSTRVVKECLPELKLHGRHPIVEYPTRNILFQFEAMNPAKSRSRRSYR